MLSGYMLSKMQGIYITTVWTEVFLVCFRREHTLQLFENKVFRKIFGPMTHEVNNL
jgi:hypothetical protein